MKFNSKLIKVIDNKEFKVLSFSQKYGSAIIVCIDGEVDVVDPLYKDAYTHEYMSMATGHFYILQDS